MNNNRISLDNHETRGLIDAFMIDSEIKGVSAVSLKALVN